MHSLRLLRVTPNARGPFFAQTHSPKARYTRIPRVFYVSQKRLSDQKRGHLRRYMVTDFLVKTQVKTVFSVSRTTTVRPQIYSERTGLENLWLTGDKIALT